MIYVDDKNEPPQHILDDAKCFYDSWFPLSDGDHVKKIRADFAAQKVGVWELGRLTSALVQMYDLVAPLDAERAGRCLERLRRIAAALLENRDDKRKSPPIAPADPSRGWRVMA